MCKSTSFKFSWDDKLDFRQREARELFEDALPNIDPAPPPLAPALALLCALFCCVCVLYIAASCAESAGLMVRWEEKPVGTLARIGIPPISMP